MSARLTAARSSGRPRSKEWGRCCVSSWNGRSGGGPTGALRTEALVVHQRCVPCDVSQGNGGPVIQLSEVGQRVRQSLGRLLVDGAKFIILRQGQPTRRSYRVAKPVGGIQDASGRVLNG